MYDCYFTQGYNLNENCWSKRDFCFGYWYNIEMGKYDVKYLLYSFRKCSSFHTQAVVFCFCVYKNKGLVEKSKYVFMELKFILLKTHVVCQRIV